MTAPRTLQPVLVELARADGPPSRRALVPARRHAGERALALATQRAGAPASLTWERRPDRPPTGPAGWFASLTNTSRLAAAVVAREPVGIDAEWCARPRLEAARTRLREIGDLDRLGRDGDLDVLTLWSAREAVLKRAGVGIAGFTAVRLTAEEPDGLRLTFAGEELLVAVSCLRDHVLAVAVRPGARVVAPYSPDEVLA